ncbi:hypothetical protein SDC9_210287 [bioreactor metagenome]|uniref:Uncharacterized protein n=1 Tax=bioreactor metagenome TaxID=1076179 RepID=A0A645JFQ8_9ZZZZ
MQPRAISDVVVDAHRERVWFLKNHADIFAQFGHVHAGGKNILAVVQHLALHPHTGHKVVHAVECF